MDKEMRGMQWELRDEKGEWVNNIVGSEDFVRQYSLENGWAYKPLAESQPTGGDPDVVSVEEFVALAFGLEYTTDFEFRKSMALAQAARSRGMAHAEPIAEIAEQKRAT